MIAGESFAIGIDVGGTTIKTGVVATAGHIIDQVAVDARGGDGPDAVIGEIAETIRQMLGKFEPSHCRGIGIGCPGTVGLDSDTVSHPPNFSNWTDVKLASAIGKIFPYPVKVENDANIAALAEARYGAGTAFDNFLFIIWGTGVGGGIIVGKEIFRGATGAAGEIGHTTIDHNGPLCNCGSRGCIEAYVGQRYLSQRTREFLKQYPQSQILSMIGGDLNKIEPVIVARAAEAGDEAGLKILSEAGELLGYALASAMNLLDMQTVIIGGGVSAAPDFVYDAMTRALTSRILKPHQPHVRVLRAKLGNTAGIVGAASLVL